MKLMRYGAPGSERPVARHEGALWDISPVTSDIDPTFFAGGGVQAVADALAAGDLVRLEPGCDRIGAPIARPGKIVCVGLNYRDHASETGAALPTEPVLFLKDPSTIVGPFDAVIIPRGSTKTDWEVELGVVIGSTARYLTSPAEAAQVIAGYVISHDVSEREFQLERGGQWDKGKSCETFNPMGPWLVTSDEVDDPQDLGLRLWVNGRLAQDGSTADMLFGVSHLVWYISQFMVLQPGDLINTGTPAGVALGDSGRSYLRSGDVVRLQIDGLGRAEQVMVAA
jgi:2-keto-4-pentenoate hydratase/2-oxohepta-3-ene-1,7-dioic acid hydratase in catechol pathway